MVVAAQKEFETPYQIIRYHNVYGPGQKNHFLPEFIDRVQQGVYELYGYENTRSFCYVQDLINGMIKVMEGDIIGPINLGNHEEISILDLAKMIKKEIKSDVDLIFKELAGNVYRLF